MRLLQAFSFVVVAADALTQAHPTYAPFISVPIHPVPKRFNVPDLPASIVHQQHANRAVRRLDYMTQAHNPATDDDLLYNLVRRAAALPPHIQKRFYHPGLGYLTALAAKKKGKASASQILAAVDSSDGPDSSYPDGVMLAEKPTFKNTIGLDIQAQDIGYLGNVSIGTPPRVFHLLMDSGSADLWVGGDGCMPDDPFSDQEDCGTHNFLGNWSSTFNDTKRLWTIQYGTGAVSGNVVTDTVSIAGLKLNKLAFGVALKESPEFTLDDIPFDGLCGFAKKIISRQNVTTLLDALVASHKIANPIVSYHIPRLADGAQNNNGELTLGALNPARYDPKTLVSVPNISPFGFWEARLQGISVGGKDLGWSNRTGIFDTGTTLIVAPQADVAAVHTNIPDAEYHADVGYWTVPCVVPKGAKPILALTIGGRSFSIDARDMVFLPVDAADPTGRCMSGISQGMIGGPTEWLIGDVFLKNVYMSTNEKTDTISFANLKL